jgi:hypothetical protein
MRVKEVHQKVLLHVALSVLTIPGPRVASPFSRFLVFLRKAREIVR